ncbi:AtpZ/AtpI family protein [Catalinimonas niigatensis]|uniref:AtpZ/AtpI family protein n=1 Tax=Catalinimonas niigatensis TaxID=1397264 RepID=UPI0026671ED7|nr:AtpZ/AtpI family protein [Catalinimonas niigatensis]WPP53656.1 AtpZ/AtpI family protein [Catalinimonas niigatensis]
MSNQPQTPKKRSQDQFKTYVKYSGLAFQMIAVLGLAVWGGMKLDDKMGNGFPLFTIIFALIAFAGSLIVIIRGLPKE